MKFRSQYDKRDRSLRSCPGNPEYITYVADEDGNPIQSGINNIYDEIQSHRESVELSVLLQRYAQGDETALNKVQGVYEDIVGCPSTLADVYEQVKEAENSFNSLPPSFRELFDNSPVAFWREVGTPEFAEKVDKYRFSTRSESKKEDSIYNYINNNNDNDRASRERSVVNESKSE